MSNLLLAYSNVIDLSASIAEYGGGGAASGHPVANLADSNFSRTWRRFPVTNTKPLFAGLLINTPTAFVPSAMSACAHNLSDDATVRFRAGTYETNFDFAAPSSYIDASLASFTFVGGGPGTLVAESGTVISLTGTSAVPRLDHDPAYYENGFFYPDDLTHWTLSKGVCYDSATARIDNLGELRSEQSLDLRVDTYMLSGKVRVISGNGDFKFFLNDGTNRLGGTVHTAIGKWQRFNVAVAALANTLTGYAGVQKVTAEGVLQFKNMQISRRTTLSRFTKSAGGSRCFQRLGMLREPASTNQLAFSGDMTVGAWAKTASLTVGLGVNSRMGSSQRMNRLTSSATLQSVTQTVTAGGTTSQCFAFDYFPSTVTSLTAIISWLTGGTTQTVSLTFNPNAIGGDLVSGTPSSSGATPGKYAIRYMGAGFWRVWLSGVGTDASNTQAKAEIRLDNASQTIDAGLPQLEARLDPTSYIPTPSGSAVTRSADAATVTSSTLLGSSVEGVIFTDVRAPEVLTSTINAVVGSVGFRDAGSANVVKTRLMQSSTNTSMDSMVVNASAVTADMTDIVANPGASTKSAFRFRGGDFQHYVAGSDGGNSAVAMPSGFTTFDLCMEVARSSHLRSVTVWAYGLGNTDLSALSVSGQGAVEFDSDWFDAYAMDSYGTPASDWGSSYDVVKIISNSRAVTQIWIDFYDPKKTNSSSDYLDVGRLFVPTRKLQPAVAQSLGLQYGVNDLSVPVTMLSGRKVFNVLPRVRYEAFDLPALDPTEAGLLHEMLAMQGQSQEVLYVRDITDPVGIQQFGMVGLLSRLDPLKYPFLSYRSGALQIEKKK